MNVVYISEISLKNKSAQTIHVLKMCDAFSKKNKINLIIPFYNNLEVKNLKKNFLLTSKRNISIKSLLDFKVRNFLSRLIFGYKTAKYLKNESTDLIISRSWISSFFLCIFKIKHFLEVHSEQKGLTKLLMIGLNFINSEYILKTVIISETLRKKLTYINKKKHLILHDAVNIENFKYKKPRNKLKSVAYVGSFHQGKGVEIILELAKNFKNLNFNIYGKPTDQNYETSKNLKIHGYINYKKVPSVLAKSDILLLPSADEQYVGLNVNVSNYNSPLKMFDYLAAGRIILSSRRDGICEILKHNFNAIIVDEYNINSWIHQLNNIIRKKYNLKKLQKNSFLTAKKYTWDKRVSQIIKANEFKNNVKKKNLH